VLGYNTRCHKGREEIFKSAHSSANGLVWGAGKTKGPLKASSSVGEEKLKD
jgi:hypothetical protein